jgi:hypothetical protein
MRVISFPPVIVAGGPPNYAILSVQGRVDSTKTNPHGRVRDTYGVDSIQTRKSTQVSSLGTWFVHFMVQISDAYEVRSKTETQIL